MKTATLLINRLDKKVLMMSNSSLKLWIWKDEIVQIFCYEIVVAFVDGWLMS